VAVRSWRKVIAAIYVSASFRHLQDIRSLMAGDVSRRDAA
jgi:hypothetical protein